MTGKESLWRFARRHRVETGFLGAAMLGIALGLADPPLWVAVLVEAPFIMVAVPWVMLGRRGRMRTGLRGPLHVIRGDLRDETWIAETIEDIERRLAAEILMDEAE